MRVKWGRGRGRGRVRVRVRWVAGRNDDGERREEGGAKQFGLACLPLWRESSTQHASTINPISRTSTQHPAPSTQDSSEQRERQPTLAASVRLHR